LNISKFTDGLKVAQTMLNCGADIFVKDKVLGATPFMFACLAKISQIERNQHVPRYRRNERFEIGYNAKKESELLFKLVNLFLEATDPSRKKELVTLGFHFFFHFYFFFTPLFFI
jgi:hypothetical protein